jgi:cytochrome P450/NADPH-cytochrome P450 reductase
VESSRVAPLDAFRTLYPERTPDADAAAAERWVNGRVAAGRYVEDVYAVG